MRDLYQALGLDGAGTDALQVVLRLDGAGLPRGLEEDARFVLLDPVRKARYDEALRIGRGLAEVRSRLGLPPDPLLPASWVASPPRPDAHSRAVPGQGNLLLRVGGFGAGGLFLLAILAWPLIRPAGRRAAQGAAVATGVRPGVEAQPKGVPPPSATREEPLPLPAPGHGTIQIEPGVRPSVPWRIETDPGRDYFLSLVDAQSQVTVLTLYLCGGMPYQGLAPEGSFRLVYASGTAWLGPRHGFAADSRSVNAPQTYRIQAGPDDTWAWDLRLHPSGSEGAPVAPPGGQDGPPPGPRP